MQVGVFYEGFRRWKAGNAVSKELCEAPAFRPQLVTYALDILAEGTEDCCHRNGNVGIYFGIGKFFYDLFRERGGMAIAGSAFFLSTSQGPAGFAHGGAVASVLDDVCGIAFGAACFTLNLQVQFKRAVPLLTTLRVESRVTETTDSPRGRKIYVVAALKLLDGTTLAEAAGLFYQPAALSNLTDATMAQASIDPSTARRRALALRPYSTPAPAISTPPLRPPRPAGPFTGPFACSTTLPSAAAEWRRWCAQDALVRELRADPALAPVDACLGDGYRGDGFSVPAARAHAFGEGKLQLALFAHRTDEGRSEAAVRFLPVTEGTGGNAHGGAVITAIDTCVWSTPALARLVSVSVPAAQAEVGFTASLSASYLKTVPLETTLRIRCALRAVTRGATDRRKRKWALRASLLSADGQVEYDNADVLIVSAPTDSQGGGGGRRRPGDEADADKDEDTDADEGEEREGGRGGDALAPADTTTDTGTGGGLSHSTSRL
jgi:acyl-coenzyme A thioesterase PaaI-like protein